MSMWAAAQPIGKIIGNVLGGVITDTVITWRGIFYVQFALGLTFVLLGFFVIQTGDKIKQYEKGFDWVGTALSVSGLGLLTYALS